MLAPANLVQHTYSMYITLLRSARLSDYQLESAYKDVGLPRRAPSMVTLKIFAVLVVRDNHVVLPYTIF